MTPTAVKIAELQNQIEALLPKAESGEQWAEICLLEAEILGGPFYGEK